MLFLLAGCATTMESLTKVEPDEYFILDEHHIRQEYRGLIKDLWVESLLLGKYIKYAEDKEGIYFLGEKPSVVILYADKAREFVKSKKISPGPFLYGSLVGGLWLPKKGSVKPPQIFYTHEQADSGEIAGIIGMAITSAFEGGLEHIPYDSEAYFVESIEIKKTASTSH